jgi:hypothetical protein
MRLGDGLSILSYNFDMDEKLVVDMRRAAFGSISAAINQLLRDNISRELRFALEQP